MGKRSTSVIVVLVSIGLLSVPAAGQQKSAAKVAPMPTPKTFDGKVDFTGIWSADPHFISDLNDALKPGESIPLQPWAAKLVKERLSKDDPAAHCLPQGVPRQVPHPWRIAQTPTHIFILYEGATGSFRQIFMNVPHPDDPDPTWYGNSTGKIEGGALVVDTIGFNEFFWFDFAGHPHTEKLHITERFRRPDFDHLDYDVTIDDPGAYTRPFTLYGHSKYEHKTELFEYVCNENNQDIDHLVGKDSRNKYSKQ